MSARSSDRPTTRKCQPSSWLITSETSPLAMAQRSPTQRRKTCGPAPFASRVRSPCQVTFRHSQTSSGMASRTPRAFSLAAVSAPATDEACLAVEHQGADQLAGVGLVPGADGLVVGQAHRIQQGPDHLVVGLPGTGRQQVQVGVQDPGGAVGPFDVPAQPVQGLGDPAQHGSPPRWSVVRPGSAGASAVAAGPAVADPVDRKPKVSSGPTAAVERHAGGCELGIARCESGWVDQVDWPAARHRRQRGITWVASAACSGCDGSGWVAGQHPGVLGSAALARS